MRVRDLAKLHCIGNKGAVVSMVDGDLLDKLVSPRQRIQLLISRPQEYIARSVRGSEDVFGGIQASILIILT